MLVLPSLPTEPQFGAPPTPSDPAIFVGFGSTLPIITQELSLKFNCNNINE